MDSDDARRDLKTVLENLKEFDIELVETETISNDIEATRVGNKLKSENADLLVLFVLHGATCDLHILVAEISELPTVIWSLPVRYSFTTSASAFGALREKKHRVKLVHGSPDDRSIASKVMLIARVAFTINRLREARIGTAGEVMRPMIPSFYDKNIVRDRLGPNIVHISTADLRSALEEVTDEQLQQELRRVTSSFRIAVDEKVLKKGLKFHLGLKAISKQCQLDAISLECHTELAGEFNINPCLGYIEADYIIGCEGEVVNTVALLMLWHLTGKYGFLTDVFSVDSRGVLTTAHCAGPSYLAQSLKQVTLCKQTPPQHPSPKIKEYYAVCRPQIPPGQATILRLFGRQMDNLHLATGAIISCDVENPAHMWVKVKLNGDPAEFVANVCGNHYIVVPGDVREELKAICEWLRIRVVET